jgi:hypothetical protein
VVRLLAFAPSGELTTQIIAFVDHHNCTTSELRRTYSGSVDAA